MDLFAKRINFSFLTLGVIFALYGSSYASNYRCGYEPEGCDQNSDCSAVVKECNGPYGGQYLCPINQTACNPSYICPSGGSYNASAGSGSIGKCQIDPSVSCPSGGSYDSSTGVCQTDPSISCPSTDYEDRGFVGVYDPSAGVCAIYNNNNGNWYGWY